MIQDALQAVAEVGLADLAGVGRADGRDDVRPRDAALEERELAVELEPLHRPPVRGQTQRVEDGPLERPLVGHVVDGEEGGGALRVVGQQRRDQTGLPVVGVNDVRAPAERTVSERDLCDGAVEDGEAQGVVPPIAPVEVDVGVAGAVEQPGGVHQVDRNRAVRQQPAQQADSRGRAGDLQRPQRLEVGDARDGVGISGKDQADVVAEAVQRGREAAGNVAQSAGLDEGYCFAGGK